MIVSGTKKYQITLEHTPEKSPAWFVRVFRRRFLFKQRVSSDWFLDPSQAKLFAEQLSIDLNGEAGVQNLRSRKPGWILHRPPR